MSSSGIRGVFAWHKNPLLGQRGIDERLLGGERCDVFCCSTQNELGQRSKHKPFPGQPYAVSLGANPWNSSPVFHFNDAESARSIRKDAIAMRSCPILALAQVQYPDDSSVTGDLYCLSTSKIEIISNSHVNNYTGFKAEQALAHLEH